MTLQTLVVLLIGATYGWRLGGATVLLYLAEGLLGLPVFANTPPAVPSPAYLAGPTGGFLVGYVAAAVVTGFLAERGWDRSLLRVVVMMTIGHAMIFAFGLGLARLSVAPARRGRSARRPSLLGDGAQDGARRRPHAGRLGCRNAPGQGVLRGVLLRHSGAARRSTEPITASAFEKIATQPRALLGTSAFMGSGLAPAARPGMTVARIESARGACRRLAAP